MTARAGARNGVELDGQAAGRGEAIVQLYLVRALAPEGPRQAIVVSLIAPQPALALRRADLDFVIGKLGLIAITLPTPPAAKRRRRQLVSGARKKSGGSSPVMVLSSVHAASSGRLGARPYGGAMYFHAFFNQRTGPLSTQPNVAIARVAIDAHVHVIVMRLGVARLAQHVGGARQHRRIRARGGRLAKEQRRQIVLDEDPLHLGARILDERAHQRPVALAVEVVVGHGAVRRLLPARRRPANRAARRR